MTDSNSLVSKEAIAREIKQIFSQIKAGNRDEEYLTSACKNLRLKSESGYRSLVRLLNKYGYLNVLLSIKNINDESIHSSDSTQPSSSRRKNERKISNSLPSTSQGNDASILTSDAPSSRKEAKSSSVNTTGSLTEKRQRSERYARTKDILSKSGLLGITNETAELLKKNKTLDQELKMLKEQTESFVQAVLSSPANQTVLRPALPTSIGAQSQSAISYNDSSNQAPQFDNSDFAGILSGIYDIELPSVILAPVSLDHIMSKPHASQDRSSQDRCSPPAQKRPKIHHNTG